MTPAHAGGSTGLPGLVDRLIPGPGTTLDRLARQVQDAVAGLARQPAVRPVHRAVHGQEWLGHPAHPLVVAVPIGAWVTSAWYDLRSARSDRARYDTVADAALRVGILSALPATVTGVAQLVEPEGGARRETLVHAAVNSVALTLYLGSWVLRRTGARPAGRRLATAGLAVVAAGGFLGGDLSYRHGVGVTADRGRHLRATA